MKVFRYKWFSSVDWEWQTAEVYAGTEKEAETFLRSKAYVSDIPYYQPNMDSLKLMNSSDEEIKFPSFKSSVKKLYE